MALDILPIDPQTGDHACDIRIENGIVLPASVYDTKSFKYKCKISQLALEHQNDNPDPFLYRNETSDQVHYIRIIANYHVDATDYDEAVIGARIFFEPIANLQRLANSVRVYCQDLHKVFITDYHSRIYVLNNHTDLITTRIG